MDDSISILHLEDSPADALLVERALAKGEISAKCHRVADRKALEEALGAVDWHLVLSDYNIPGLSFEGALEIIRRHRPDVPLIVVSGCLGEERAVSLLKQGVTDFVLKDSLGRLAPSIRRSLREAEENRARAAAERKLRESELRLRMTLEAAELVGWDWTLASGDFQETGPVGLVYGHSADYRHREFDAFIADIHPEDRNRVRQELETTAQDRSTPSISLEFRITDGLGDLRWLEAVCNVLGDDTNTPQHVLGIVRDITSKKRIDDSLREQLELRNSLMEAIPSAICYKDELGRYQGCNKAFEELFQRPRAEVVGKTILDLYGHDRSKCHAEADAMLLAGHRKDIVYDSPFLQPDGTIRDLYLSKAVYTHADGSVAGVVAIMIDMTERNQTERKMRQLATAVEQNPCSIIITDRSGAIEYVNPKFSEITGFSPEEIIGCNPRILKSSYTNDSEYKKLWQTISSGQVWRGELYNKRKDGTLFWESVSISPVMADGKTITHYIGIKEDITERKMQEEILIEAKERAEAGNQAKSQFLAMMNHEMHTPLNSIIGFSEIMTRERDETKIDDKYRRYAQNIAECGRSLLVVIDNILSFSKISGNDTLFHRDVFSLSHLLNDVTLTVQARAKTACIRLNIGLPDPSLCVVADEQAIYQAMVLLLTNAIKFSRIGGFVEVQFHLDRDKTLSLAIIDNGIGIAPENLRRVLEPFTQADSSFNRRYEGTGVGLPLAKRLIERNDGQLRLDSILGEGTTVTITLPPNRVIWGDITDQYAE